MPLTVVGTVVWAGIRRMAGCGVCAIALPGILGCAVPLGAEGLPTEPQPSLDEAAVLPIVLEPVLPMLSEAAIADLQADLAAGIETWFGLAGLDKMPAPPAFSTELQNYQREWAIADPDVHAFLGVWHDGEAYAYSVSIFPSATPGQVCVLEFRPEWSLQIWNEVTGEYGKDVISEQILSFSVATVEDGQLRSSPVQSVGSAIALSRFTVGEAYPVVMMAVLDDQGTSRVVAAATPPMISPNLPESLVQPLSQALADHGCEVSPSPAI
mgnify:CR=1 FL=1